MKICLITTMTPASENIRGTSALPYHLIKGSLTPFPSPNGEGSNNINVNANANENRSEELLENNSGYSENSKLETENFIIYTFNNNNLSDEKITEVEKELGVTIKKVPLPKWFLFVFKYKLLFLRLFLRYPIHHYVKLPQKYVDEIKSLNPDLIWVYGAEWSKVVNQFDGFQRIHTLPDSEALYYYRMLGSRFVISDWKKFWRCAFMYPKFLRLERSFDTNEQITYHLVGEKDVEFLRNVNPGINARFLRHPHYEVRQHFINGSVNDNENKSLTPNPSPKGEGDTHFHQPKIKLLIAGQYNLYMKQEADLLIEQLAFNENDNSLTPNPSLKERRIKDFTSRENSCVRFLQENYVITFLGKGWERHVEILRGAGFEVEHIRFAPDYIEEICKHDIQITPISIGTGTKGKVLDALANGLLVIGTPYAMENIAVKGGESCIEYRDAKEVIDVLKDIPANLHKYEMMAEKGRQCVLEYHDRAKIAKELFNLSMQV